MRVAFIQLPIASLFLSCPLIPLFMSEKNSRYSEKKYNIVSNPFPALLVLFYYVKNRSDEKIVLFCLSHKKIVHLGGVTELFSMWIQQSGAICME